MVFCEENFFNVQLEFSVQITTKTIFSQTTITKLFMNQSQVSALPARSLGVSKDQLGDVNTCNFNKGKLIFIKISLSSRSLGHFLQKRFTQLLSDHNMLYQVCLYIRYFKKVSGKEIGCHAMPFKSAHQLRKKQSDQKFISQKL